MVASWKQGSFYVDLWSNGFALLRSDVVQVGGKTHQFQLRNLLSAWKFECGEWQWSISMMVEPVEKGLRSSLSRRQRTFNLVCFEYCGAMPGGKYGWLPSDQKRNRKVFGLSLFEKNGKRNVLFRLDGVFLDVGNCGFSTDALSATWLFLLSRLPTISQSNSLVYFHALYVFRSIGI